MISLRTATLLFAVLAIAALLTLKGKPLVLTLIIVGALAAKSYLSYLREKQTK